MPGLVMSALFFASVHFQRVGLLLVTLLGIVFAGGSNPHNRPTAQTDFGLYARSGFKADLAE